MEVNRRVLMQLTGIAAASFGAQAVFPQLSLAQGAGEARELKASLGSKVLAASVAFFWIGMHERLNYFQEEGVIANWRGVESQSQAMSLIIAGQQAMGGVGPATLLGLAADGKKVPLKVAYAHYQRNPYRGAVLADSEIESWADVVQRKVGLLSLAQLSTKWYAEGAVREAGGDPSTLEFLPIGQHGPAGANLKNGAVDVYVSHANHILAVKQLGFPLRELPEPSFAGYRSFDGGMTVHSDMLKNEEDRKALIGFFRAVVKGAVFSVENPRAAQIIHYDLFPESVPKGKSFDVALEEATRDYKANLELTIPKGQNSFFGMQTREKWETVAYEIMQLSKEQIADVGEFYSADLIEEANDFDHEAVLQQARDFKD